MNLKRISAGAVRTSARLMTIAGVTALLVGGAQPSAAGLFAAPYDKIIHFVCYSVLALLIGLASGYRGKKLLLVAFFGATGVGMVDEFFQMSYPGRQADVADLVADAFGAVLGTLCLAACARRFPNMHM